MENNFSELAEEQYDLAINGINQKYKVKAIRMEKIYDEGYALKPKDFTNWEDVTKKQYANDISRINSSKKNKK